jgi:outer membrane murein-binding lipoprotein Lpp
LTKIDEIDNNVRDLNSKIDKYSIFLRADMGRKKK